MARKATRLRFTEDELANPKIKKAASKAEKAADQADRAAAKTPKKRKLKLDAEKAAERKVHLTFEKQEIPMGELTGRGNRFTRSAAHSAAASVSGTIHGQVSANNQDDNTAVQAVNTSAEAAEAGAHAVDHAIYSKKLKPYEKAERLQTKSDAANVEAIYQQRMAEHPEEFSTPVSRWQQKKAIRKEYAAARRAEETAANASTAAKEGAAGVKSLGQRLAEFKDKALEYVAEHPQAFLVIGALAILLIIVSSALSSCSAFLPGGSGAVIATTFTANDEDIIGANNDYKALEAALQRRIDNIESSYPGYDEYNYYLDEIGHDPYQLAAYLTVLFEDYTRSEVQATLHTLFELQYELKLEENHVHLIGELFLLRIPGIRCCTFRDCRRIRFTIIAFSRSCKAGSGQRAKHQDSCRKACHHSLNIHSPYPPCCSFQARLPVQDKRRPCLPQPTQ